MLSILWHASWYSHILKICTINLFAFIVLFGSHINCGWLWFALNVHCPDSSYNLCASITTFDSVAATLISHVLVLHPLHRHHQQSGVTMVENGLWPEYRTAGIQEWKGSCNCRRLSILFLIAESFCQREIILRVFQSVATVAFHSNHSSVPNVSAQFLCEDQLYVLSKYFVSFFVLMLYELLTSDNLLANCCG